MRRYHDWLNGLVVLIALCCPAPAAETPGIFVLSDGYKLDRDGTHIWSLAKLDLAALQKKNAIWDAATGTITVAAARQETVAFQIVIPGGAEGLKEVNITVDDLTGPQGKLPAAQLHLFKEWYVETKSASSDNCAPSTGAGWYPDALVPWSLADHGSYDGPPFAVEKQQSQAVWVDLEVPPGTPPGLYTGKLKVTAGGADQPHGVLTLQLRVRNLELPAEIHHLLLANCSAADIWDAGGYWLKDKPAAKEHYEEALFKLAREHRITMGNMYYDSWHDAKSLQPNIQTDKEGNITGVDWAAYDERFSRYLDPKKNCFGPGAPAIEYWRLPINPGFTKKQFPKEDKAFAQFPAWIQKHWQEKGWDFDRAYVYLADEPKLNELANIGKIAQVLAKATQPPVHMQVAILAAKDTDKFTAEYRKQLNGTLDRWMWSANSVDVAALRKQVRPTDWVGFYQGNEPYCPVHVLDKDGLALRAWSWIAWQYHVNYSCYFSITECTVLLKEDDYSNFAKQPDLIWTQPKNRPNGNQCKAVCMYPGGFVGSDLPIPNIRLKAMRRGQQDYEYMYLAAKADAAQVDVEVKSVIHKALSEAADEPNKIGSQAGAWETDPEKWDAVVAAWADRLEKSATPAP